MESEFRLGGDLIVGADLDLSKINTEGCGSVASWNLSLTKEQIKELNEASKYGTRCKYNVSYCVEHLKEAMEEYKEK